MTTILVTGGAGYIGSHVCKVLRGAGYIPIVYDDLSHGHREAVKWGPLEEGNLLDRARLNDVLSRHRPMGAIHLAGLISVAESVREPERYHLVNTEGSRVLADALEAHGVERLVFSSTAAVYGLPDEVPIPETAPLKPINPYGESKLEAERIFSARGFRSVFLRYFNAAGADPQGEAGECHDPETHLIPLILRAALGRAPSVKVFGSDYPTRDGTCVRDYVHVLDLARAHVLALHYLERRGVTCAFNLGTEKGTTVREVIQAVERVTGRRVSVELCPRREGDPAQLVAASVRARSFLEWIPAYSSIEEIVRTAYQWESGSTSSS